MTERLLIVQPYVPEYRRSLFRVMREQLALNGVELILAAGSPRGQAKKRQDDVTEECADILLQDHSLHLGRREIGFRPLGAAIHRTRPAMVILEQAIKNFEAYPLLMRQRLVGHPRVALWGHGRSYSVAQGVASRAVKKWLTHSADWLFVYTAGGAQYVVDHGYPQSRLTVLKNSSDTTALRRDLMTVTEADVVEFRRRWGIPSRNTAIFIGGIDEAKGIRFLVEAATRVGVQVPDFTLVLAGEGAAVPWVRMCQQRGLPLRWIGRIEGRDKAVALKAARCLTVPEWVGLVAVDALASGVPIVTTRHSSHSPEAEYLTEGESAIFVDHDLDAYASSVIDLIADDQFLAKLSDAAASACEGLSAEAMAERFVGGIRDWRENSVRRQGPNQRDE